MILMQVRVGEESSATFLGLTLEEVQILRTEQYVVDRDDAIEVEIYQDSENPGAEKHEHKLELRFTPNDLEQLRKLDSSHAICLQLRYLPSFYMFVEDNTEALETRVEEIQKMVRGNVKLHEKIMNFEDF